MDRKFLRPGWIVGHLLVVLAVLVCLRLGRWQWDRMHEGGTVQNLGYAVLWPVFGAAFVYMWFRFLQLETLKDAEDDAELTALAAGTGPRTGQEERAVVPGTAIAPPGLPQVSTPDSTGEPGATPTGGSAPSTREDGRAWTPVPTTPGDLDLSAAAPNTRDGGPDDCAPPGQHRGSDQPTAPPRAARNTPSTGVTVAVATVGADDEDEDPELAAYNRALAALAEKDHRRAY